MMATVKVKFFPSSVTVKAGTFYYQLTHRREKQQIASDICLLPDQWETVIRSTATTDDATDTLRERIKNDAICLKRITDRLEKSNEPYSVHDIVRQWQGTCILASMQAQIDRLHRCKCLGTVEQFLPVPSRQRPAVLRDNRRGDRGIQRIPDRAGYQSQHSLVLHENHAGRLQQSRTRTTGRTKAPLPKCLHRNRPDLQTGRQRKGHIRIITS